MSKLLKEIASHDIEMISTMDGNAYVELGFGYQLSMNTNKDGDVSVIICNVIEDSMYIYQTPPKNAKLMVSALQFLINEINKNSINKEE